MYVIHNLDSEKNCRNCRTTETNCKEIKLYDNQIIKFQQNFQICSRSAVILQPTNNEKHIKEETLKFWKHFWENNRSRYRNTTCIKEVENAVKVLGMETMKITEEIVQKQSDKVKT